MDGSAVNFTLVSNYENLDFGIVACRKSVPHVQRLIDYMEESLVELEDAAGLRRRKSKRKISAGIGAAVKSKGKAKAKARAKARTKAKSKAAAKPARTIPRLKAKTTGKSRTRPKQSGSTK